MWAILKHIFFLVVVILLLAPGHMATFLENTLKPCKGSSVLQQISLGIDKSFM